MRVMLIGLGDLGSVLLEMLARDPLVGQIIVASRSAQKGSNRCNLVRLGAVAQGFGPDISFVSLDLTDPEQIVQRVRQQSPDVIVLTATRLTWWLQDLLPDDAAQRLRRIGFGMWLPVHLSLAVKLMQALRELSFSGLTLIAPYPDVVNQVLGKLGLAPTAGIGNVDELVPKLRVLAAQELDRPVEEVGVRLVAHHSLQRFVFSARGDREEPPPFYVSVTCGGEDVTGRVKARQLLFRPYPITPGTPTHFLTASSATRLIRSLFHHEQTLVHVPGPRGLPGGYPVFAGNRRIQLADLLDLTHDEAVKINEDSHTFDGIDSVEQDGTVVFCDRNRTLGKKVLGYDCARLPPSEIDERADELVARFAEYAHRSEP